MQVVGNGQNPDQRSDTVADGRRGAFAFLGQAFVIAPSDGAGAGLPDSEVELVGTLHFDGCRHLIYRMTSGRSVEARTVRLTELLTRRELEIAILISEGRCDKEIGRSLGISSYTVREHVRRTCCKLGVSRRAAIASVVIRGLCGMAPGEAQLSKWADGGIQHESAPC